MEIQRGICNHENVANDDDDDDDDDDMINRIWNYKSKLMNMTRDQYHYEMVNNSDDETTKI